MGVGPSAQQIYPADSRWSSQAAAAQTARTLTGRTAAAARAPLPACQPVASLTMVYTCTALLQQQ